MSKKKNGTPDSIVLGISGEALLVMGGDRSICRKAGVAQCVDPRTFCGWPRVWPAGIF